MPSRDSYNKHRADRLVFDASVSAGGRSDYFRPTNRGGSVGQLSAHMTRRLRQLAAA